jgi:hypothetical protein
MMMVEVQTVDDGEVDDALSSENARSSAGLVFSKVPF